MAEEAEEAEMYHDRRSHRLDRDHAPAFAARPNVPRPNVPRRAGRPLCPGGRRDHRGGRSTEGRVASRNRSPHARPPRLRRLEGHRSAARSCWRRDHPNGVPRPWDRPTSRPRGSRRFWQIETGPRCAGVETTRLGVSGAFKTGYWSNG